jgi:hypothetical protein
MPDFLKVMYDALATTATPRASRLFLVKASSEAAMAMTGTACGLTTLY